MKLFSGVGSLIALPVNTFFFLSSFSLAWINQKALHGSHGLALMLVNVFAHDLKLALAEYAIKAKEKEPTVLKKALSQLFKQYPGLKILVMVPEQDSEGNSGRNRSLKKKSGEEQWELWVDSDLGALLIGQLAKFSSLKQIAYVRKRI